ncbi:MAG: ATP-binding protein [Kofleriaceae bacterium]
MGNAAGQSRRAQILDAMHERMRRSTANVLAWVFGGQMIVLVVASACRHAADITVISLFALISIIPIVVLKARPQRAIARHLAAATVMVLPAFHGRLGSSIFQELGIFVAVTLLASYRDWKVLLAAGGWVLAVQVVDQSSWQSFSERFALFTLELVVLCVGCIRANRDMEDAANREATLEHTALTIQRKVDVRTRALVERTERYRSLVENTEAIPFEFDIAERRIRYVGPKAISLFGLGADALYEPGVMTVLTHPDDLELVREQVARYVRGERPANEPLDYRLIPKGGVCHVRTFMSDRHGSIIRGVMLDITRQVSLERELRQAQKLESVGRLAAGVAHEINTPVQFVNDSLEFIGSAMTSLLEAVMTQSAALSPTATPAQMEAARAAVEGADLEFVQAELPVSMQRASEGLRRITDIVRSMKTFAHPHGNAMTESDLKREIESTLAIARSEYKYVADLITTYDDMDRVKCCASEINQVVLNLVVNAAHAISDVVHGTVKRGVIEVRLYRDGGEAVISVRDTGSGIPDSVREHIFEQFFTTKPVGQGTGQGLSIAMSIARRHRGSLTFESKVGVGTTFYLRVPTREDSSLAA